MPRRIIRKALRISFFAGASAVLFYACTVWYVYDNMRGFSHLPAECGIVFGTAVWPVYDEQGIMTSSIAGPGIRRRVSTAAGLFKEGQVNRLFLTGGKGEGSRKSEAEVMRGYALQLGVYADRITIEDQSRSTWENLTNTRNLTSGCKSVVAISDGYHLARIALMAHFQGRDIQTYPADLQPNTAFTLQNLLREAAGIDLLVVERLLT